MKKQKDETKAVVVRKFNERLVELRNEFSRLYQDDPDKALQLAGLVLQDELQQGRLSFDWLAAKSELAESKEIVQLKVRIEALSTRLDRLQWNIGDQKKRLQKQIEKRAKPISRTNEANPSIRDIGLHPKSARALLDKGVTNLSDATNFTAKELLKVRLVAEKTLVILRNEMEARGWRFKEDAAAA